MTVQLIAATFTEAYVTPHGKVRETANGWEWTLHSWIRASNMRGVAASLPEAKQQMRDAKNGGANLK
jgi:hypothetical protein